MRSASRPSWRIELGDDSDLSAALWIRDATGIVVEADDVPPCLTVRPPASRVLDGQDLSVVGRDWLAWWRALLEARLDRRHNPPPGGAGNALRQWAVASHARVAAAGSMSDDFAALAHAPGLQRACRELARQAHAARTRPGMESTPWPVYKQVVDEVAAARRVDPGRLDGTVVVTPTGGGWWRVIEPGFVLASDDAPTHDVVRAALESAL